jgi:hypothetical protein
MKNKKLLSTIIILIAAVFSIATYSVLSGIAQKPTVTEAEFPFTITYELDGKEVTIDDVYNVRYDGNGGYADTKSRIYVGGIGDLGEGNTVYTLKSDESYKIELWTNFYPEHLMGDLQDAGYFDEEPFEPRIYYYEIDGSGETEYSDAETLAAQGVKLISFEYPEPIENSLVFSHISYFSGEIVFPTLLISLLFLIAIIIFVKKEKDLIYKPIDKISIVFNLIISLTLLPFTAISGMLFDINGGGPEFSRQVFYFFPSFIVLCNALSIALRRKGYGVKAIVSILTAPAIFLVYLVICGVAGYL